VRPSVDWKKHCVCVTLVLGCHMHRSSSTTGLSSLVGAGGLPHVIDRREEEHVQPLKNDPVLRREAVMDLHAGGVVSQATRVELVLQPGCECRKQLFTS